MIDETHNPEQSHVAADCPNERIVMRDCDWQVTAILADNLFIETDCNSGDTRRVRKSRCVCGKEMWIEYNTTGFRSDGKRIFYPYHDEYHNVFRCENCSRPVSESVIGAEYDA